jgi:hypothetical protein
MSWDLAVFAPDRPDVADPPRDDVSVDGPLEVEDEDLPDEVAAALLVCRFSVEISVPAGAPGAAVRAAKRYVRSLAKEAAGVVYDPQEDAIVFPRSTKRLRTPVVSRDRDDDDGGRLELMWLVARRLTAADGEALLDVLERDMAEALPRRFGTYEPMQGRLERDGRGAFTALWDGDSMADWSGRAPFDYGSVWLRRGFGSALTEAQRMALRPTLGGRQASEVDAVKLAFREEVVRDERWMEAIARLFARVAERYSPFFAAAYVRGEYGDSLMGRWWLGIPDAPLLLQWIGAPYLPFLPEQLPDDAERGEDHVFVRAPDQFGWPPQVIRRGAANDEQRAAELIPELG